jgi:glycosyltransferase involved in cell wall biosynthesis
MGEEMNPTISVIIAEYNRLHLLGNVVDSILAQTLPVTEIIVVDDGSREHTPEVAERYIQERPAWWDRVRYIYQENQGQGLANNDGIA